jgi:hypothetical protein
LEDLDSCVNCDAGLIAASTICPQCGWPKGKPIEPVEESEEIKEPTEEPTEVKNRLPRPAGVRLISIFYMAFGISLTVFAIIFVSAVMFLVMLSGMGTLGDIGGTGGMGNMMMLPGMDGIDASTKSSLDSIIDLNGIAGSPSASEIEMRMNSSGIMNIDVMMEIIEEAGVIAVIEIIVGLVIFGIGLFLFKGKKLARLVTIISSIISIPLVVVFVTADVLVILGMVAVNGVVLYYMLKSKAREYFNQPSIKKPKIKKSKNNKSKKKES